MTCLTIFWKGNEMKLKIGVLFGGKSVEHDISIISAQQTIAAINKEKYDVLPIYMSKDDRFYIRDGYDKISTFKDEENLFKGAQEIFFYRTEEGKITYGFLPKFRKSNDYLDLFIPVVHGAGTEDGTVAAFLDVLGATYVTADLTPSAIAQDKVFTKLIYRESGINVIKGEVLNKDDFDYNEYETHDLKYPLIVKPATLGSSIGITYVHDRRELTDALKKAFTYDDKVLIEEALEKYREFNCAVLKTGSDYRTSAVEEVIPSKDILSFSDKYEQSNSKLQAHSNRIIPASVTQEMTDEIKKQAILAFKTLGLRGVSRVDFLYDTKAEKLYVNEINTIPGSLSFYLFEKEGVNFTELIELLIKDAFYQKNQEDQLIHHFSSSVLSQKSQKLSK
jgi:D-alanine-D-alanine ligase